MTAQFAKGMPLLNIDKSIYNINVLPQATTFVALFETRYVESLPQYVGNWWTLFRHRLIWITVLCTSGAL